MGLDNAELESASQQAEGSSDDLRSALQSAMAEVSERARDEQGRFAKADGKPAAPPAQDAQQGQQVAPDAGQALQTAQAAQQADQQHQQAAQTGQQQAQAVKPPDAWSPAAKAKFATLDPELQAEIVKRETEVHKGFTKQDEHRNLGKNFEQAITPYLPMIRAEGGDPIQAVQEMLQTAYTLRTATPAQKQELFIGLAGQFGVDMNAVFQRLAGGQQPAIDPQVVHLQQQVQQLQQVIQGSQQQVQAQEVTQIHQTIEGFASDPKNVYFANVKADMAALLREGRAADLQEAYDMACWARPDIRPILLQQQEQQRQADLRAKADKARRAGASVSGAPGGPTAGAGADPNASLRETIRAAMHEHTGTV